ncbi:hypothetical protein PVAND_000061 [Polypedilum vanderplanki]|uniref:Cytochrome P450 n=1 Tax=Polypedilum vanderplanki TaxID=319348 RepID=A0A9J6BJL3_POLVA|nr:hypothetical protein PVAND_000061 [Polypedilum vanderplanki]
MFLANILLFLVLPIVAIVYLYFNKKFSYFKNLGIPYIEPKFPLGNLNGIGSTRHMYDIVRNIYDELHTKGPVVGMYNLTQPFYYITDLELIKNITIKDFNNFINRGVYSNEKDEPLTAHLFTLEDEKWRFLRNKLSIAFTSGKMKLMYYTIGDKGHDLVTLIEKASKNNKTINIKDITNLFATDVVSSVAFGMESNTMNGEHPELKRFFKEIFAADGYTMLKFFFLMSFPKLGKFLKMRLFSKEMSDFFINIVGGNIAYREKINDNRPDFLNMLIQLKNKGSIDGDFSTETRKLTFNEIIPQAFVFFFDKLREEINEKTKGEKGEITYENLHEMTYLNQVINETLRMYTGGFALIRKSAEDYPIPNSKIIIPKGASVFIPIIGLHYDERYWKNPEKFDPGRFTQEEIAKRPNYCYQPFGEGLRNCIGKRFALLNVKFGVAVIIKNFKVFPDDKMKYPIKMNPKNPNLEAEGGFWLRFEKI